MKFIEMKENEILGIVEPIMDNCLNGSNEDNHAKHTRDFTERMRKIVTPENLKLQLSYKYNYKDGKKDGVWVNFNQDGSLKKTETWKDGEKID